MTGYEKSPDYGSRWTVLSTLWTVTLLLVMGGAVFACAGAFGQTPTTQIVGVASITDGDTIEIHGQSIRLNGIDAPERGARCGEANVYQQAALALSEHVGSRTVTCEISGRDRYQRAIGTCSVGGADVAEFMVSNGWARDWPRYSGGRYASAEAAARSARSGVWNANCPADLWGNRTYSAQ